MSGYKLMYNTPDGGKGSLGLMKNYAFNNSMCDGIYLKQVVPPSTTETTLTMAYHASQFSMTVAGGQTITAQDCFLNFSLSKAVDEYITIVVNAREEIYNQIFNEYYYKDQSVICILSPGKKTYTTDLFYDFYIIDSVYVYAGKRLVFHEVAEETGDDLRHKYFNAILKDSSGNIKENIVAPNTITMTCNNESLYVYPLCKDFKIENNNDSETSSIYLPAFRYKDEIYYPTIKISDNKEDVLNKAVGYMPSFIGNAFKEEYSLKDEDISAENTGDLGDGAGLEFDPSDFDFTPPKFEGGIVFPETTFNETTKEIVKESITTAVKDTSIIEVKPVEDTSGDSSEKEYQIIGGGMVKYKSINVFSSTIYSTLDFFGTGTAVVKVIKGSVKTYPVFNEDGEIIGEMSQMLNENGEVIFTQASGEIKSGSNLYINEETGAYTIVNKNGDIIMNDGQDNQTRYEYTGGTNNVGHDVYYGPDGFPVYIWTDPDTGEKIIM